jgi:hypothetical protein
MRPLSPEAVQILRRSLAAVEHFGDLLAHLAAEPEAERLDYAQAATLLRVSGPLAVQRLVQRGALPRPHDHAGVPCFWASQLRPYQPWTRELRLRRHYH